MSVTAKDLNRFLEEKLDVDEFKSLIESQVEIYSEKMEKRGSCIELHLIENEAIVIDNTKMKRLIGLVINGHLSNIHLAYICDCLSLTEDIEFENDAVKGLFFQCVDPEINGGYKSLRDLKAILAQL
jgi:hypothetical protein